MHIYTREARVRRARELHTDTTRAQSDFFLGGGGGGDFSCGATFNSILCNRSDPIDRRETVDNRQSETGTVESQGLGLDEEGKCAKVSNKEEYEEHEEEEEEEEGEECYELRRWGSYDWKCPLPLHPTLWSCLEHPTTIWGRKEFHVDATLLIPKHNDAGMLIFFSNITFLFCLFWCHNLPSSLSPTSPQKKNQ